MSADQLDREARSFLDEALAVEPELGQGARQRMRAHLLRSVAGASVVATGVAATQTSLAAGVATTGSTALAVGSAAPAAATAVGSATAATTLTKAVLGLVALGLAGGGATAAWQLRRPLPTEIAEIARVSPAHGAPGPELALPAPAKEPPPEVPRGTDESVPPMPAAPPERAPTAPHDDSLRARREAHPLAKGAPTARSVPAPDSFPEELAMLERARVALAAGDWQQSLGEIAGTGRLASTRTFAEERDALRILALCAGGRDAEARRLTAAFRIAFPRSLHMERIERACSKVVTDGEPGGHPRSNEVVR